MNPVSRGLLALALSAAAGAASAQTARFFENDAFRGRSFGSSNAVRDFTRMGFNDRASSMVIRGSAWEVCSDARFGGNCAVVRPGRYGSLRAMGLNDRISSARPLRRGPR